MHKIKFFEDPEIELDIFLVDLNGKLSYIFEKNERELDRLQENHNIQLVKKINIDDYCRSVSIYIESPSGERGLFCLPLTTQPEAILKYVMYKMGWTSRRAPQGTLWKVEMSHDEELDKCWKDTFVTFCMCFEGGFYKENLIKCKGNS